MTAIIANGASAAPAQPRAKDSSGSGLVAALVFALFGSLLALGAAAAPSPAGGAPVPVGVFVLGGSAQDAMAIVTAANGRILADTAIGGGVVAISDEPGFRDRLYSAGASLVLGVSGKYGCGPQI
ncbi:hypothetical protein FRZ44_30070 [Hypericibacter terrae]|uniref:Uncharacterized protein n=1 Tax=Hypericibacter terrae TaxID=2602015 RepID=A0A5J6MJU2_9PROT|nr:hypothetical protein [Hypericibacter terrae]QEX17704.1 hypothetical protein FRZ44_30070 [Hypericibacter terrae]